MSFIVNIIMSYKIFYQKRTNAAKLSVYYNKYIIIKKRN